MSETPCIYVLVPLFNRFENVPRLLKQLEAQSHSNYRLVLIDHGTERLPVELKDESMIYLEGSTTDWWSGAINIGLRHLLDEVNVPDSDFILLQNDDVIFGDNLLSGLLNVQRENPFSVVGAITLKKGTHEIIDAHNRLDYWLGTNISPLRGKLLEEVREPLLSSDVLKGRGVLYPVHAVRKIGLVDERLHYRADPEWSYRALKAGYTLFIVPTISVETVLDSNIRIQKLQGLALFRFILYSKHSPYNLYYARIYLQDCFGPVAFLWPFTIHTIRTLIRAVYYIIRG